MTFFDISRLPFPFGIVAPTVTAVLSCVRHLQTVHTVFIMGASREQADSSPQARRLPTPRKEMRKIGTSEAPALGKQETKSLRTRNAICEATVSCLVEHGYGETTLARVVEKAGLSNGALLHHFPSKEHLMTATAEYLFGRTLNRPKRRLPERATETDVIAADLRTNWSYYINTPQYRALLEILIASRTDRKLKKQIEGTLHEYHERAVRHMMATYESATGNPEDAELLPVMSNIFFRGLLIQDQYSADPKTQQRMVERWIEIVAPLLRPRESREE
jgi:AcrR family transcriptional regulator